MNTLQLPPISTNTPKAFRSDLIRLNVGGIRYEVSRSTMTRYEGLASLAESWNDQKYNNELFLFRNGQLFAYILDYVRSGNVHLPSFISIKVFKEELEYYKIPVDMSKIVEEKDYFTVDRLNREIEEHQAAMEALEKQRVAIVESYRLAYQFAELCATNSNKQPSIVAPSFPVRGNINKKMLHECLLSRGLEAYGYLQGPKGATISLGTTPEIVNGAHDQHKLPFLIFENETTPLVDPATISAATPKMTRKVVRVRRFETPGE
ncbi:potassium voltage-gated channel Shaw-related subfamily C member 3 [Fistulifera solaris]|jgi:hypothetical protein|uniref:Potassium voltage-gated channel Shaw-related subfamily C member 3 n=1 Tax=Fistulifera solaris TaxID=1519565 RepID=A0A1Z5K8I3_FISSO|nr:potassium voltage-gated channel Shaw-related subfamily C member 3 [Fistulifera solaris]|eukprot:GAX22431.1 potassium voltage-gated channel Shaw-related subfamily C member 3 [Fistulifera solaris]